MFLESAFIFAVPAIPYNYIINLFYNNVKRKKKKYQIFDVFILWWKYQIVSNYQIFDVFILWWKYQIISNYQIFDILCNFYFYAIYRRKVLFFVKISNCIKRFYCYIFRHFWKSAKNCKYQIFDIFSIPFCFKIFQKNYFWLAIANIYF